MRKCGNLRFKMDSHGSLDMDFSHSCILLMLTSNANSSASWQLKSGSHRLSLPLRRPPPLKVIVGLCRLLVIYIFTVLLYLFAPRWLRCIALQPCLKGQYHKNTACATVYASILSPVCLSVADQSPVGLLDHK